MGAGTANITATFPAASGFTGATATQTLTVNKAPQTITFVALNNVAFSAAPITLGATASSALPVTYMVTGPATLTGNTLNLTGAGSITVTANQAGNGNYEAAPALINTFCVLPVTPVITTANVHALMVSNPTPGITAYEWFKDGVLIPNVTAANFIAEQMGRYTVKALAGTCASALSAEINIMATGIKEDQLAQDVRVYPNPTTTVLSVRASDAGKGDALINLYDLTGRIMLQQKVKTNTNKLEVDLPVSHLPRGNYLLVISTPHGFITRHVILK